MGSLFTNVVLMTLVLLLVRRWRTPFRSFALIFALNTCCMSAINGSVEWFGVLASAVSGLFADAFIARFDPSAIQVLELRWLSALLPLVIWGSHYTVRQLTGGLPLEPEIWSGVIVMTALTGLVLSVLVVPPRIPEVLETGHESH
jgi:hypothetical protein